MIRDPKLFCPHCSKPLTPGEMIEQFCETCERPAKAETRDEPKRKVA